MGDVKAPLIKQNLDTGFLKMIAIISMAADHVAKIFFPDNMVLAIIGRIAFPLFAYCLVVGCLYTHDFKKYILRLIVFALISQPFYVLAFAESGVSIWEYILAPNIFFTLVAGVLAVSALMDIKNRWWMLLIPIAMELLIGLDYGFYGIGLMIVFYLCRNTSWLSLLLTVAWMCWNALFGDFVMVFGVGLDLQFFALLALPFIYIHTNFKPKINKYVFYAFYPAHFLIICLVRVALDI